MLAVATQQAMIKHFGLTYRAAAAILNRNPRTIWQHVAARTGSKVAAWETRSEAQRAQAIENARKLIEKHNA